MRLDEDLKLLNTGLKSKSQTNSFAAFVQFRKSSEVKAKNQALLNLKATFSAKHSHLKMRGNQVTLQAMVDEWIDDYVSSLMLKLQNPGLSIKGRRSFLSTSSGNKSPFNLDKSKMSLLAVKM